MVTSLILFLERYAVYVMNTKHTQLPFIRKLLAHKSDKEIKEAEERFFDFLDLAERIHTRIQREEDT